MYAPDDSELLHAWTARRDEAAFRMLVERYAGLVHGAALRRAGDAELAAEAAQDVFVRMARNAASIRRAEALPAWLHAAAVRAAADRVRSESRHRERMKRLHSQQAANGGSDAGQDDATWRDALPLLDEAVARLGETDRGLVLARYCQGESLAVAAQRFGLSPAAAQKRGERALERLALMLRRRGVVLGAAALAAGMAPRLSHAAPAGVQAQCAAAGLSAAPSAAGPAVWFALMNAKAISIAAAVAAFCVPVGLQLHASPRPPQVSGNAAAPSGSSAATGSQAGKSGAQSHAAALRKPDGSMDLAALEQAIRSFPPRRGRLKRELEIRRALLGLDSPQCASAAAWLEDAPGAEGEGLTALTAVGEALFRHWASLDREAALAALPPGNQGRRYMSAVLGQWAHEDARGLFGTYAPMFRPKQSKAAPLTPPEKRMQEEATGAAGEEQSQNTRQQREIPGMACAEALQALGSTDPAAALAAAADLRAAGGPNMTQKALDGWMARSWDEPLAWVARVEDPTERTNFYRALISQRQQSHPEQAWASLLSWPDRIAAGDLASSTLNAWAAHAPDAAVEAWLAGPEAWRNKSSAASLAGVLNHNNPQAANRLAEELPDGILRAAFSARLKVIRRARPNAPSVEPAK